MDANSPTRVLALEERQAAAEARLTEVERRIAELEAAATRQLPCWPVTTDRIVWPDNDRIADPEIAKILSCHVCGLLFEGVMGYVCPRADCPRADCPSAVTYRAVSKPDTYHGPG